MKPLNELIRPNIANLKPYSSAVTNIRGKRLLRSYAR